MQLFKLFSISKIQGKVCGNNGFPDDLKYLLIFAGAQIGEDIVPFQLWKSKNTIKSTSSNSEMISVFTSPDRLHGFTAQWQFLLQIQMLTAWNSHFYISFLNTVMKPTTKPLTWFWDCSFWSLKVLIDENASFFFSSL